MRRPESYARKRQAQAYKRHEQKSFLRQYPVGEYIEVSCYLTQLNLKDGYRLTIMF